MQPVTQGTIVQAAYGTVATPGTVTSTGIDWSPTYMPDFSYMASAGAISAAGTVVAHVQGSNDDAAYTSIGSVTFNDAAGGTVTKAVDVDPRAATYRYYRSLITAVGGTVSGVSAAFIGHPRTT